MKLCKNCKFYDWRIYPNGKIEYICIRDKEYQGVYTSPVTGEKVQRHYSEKNCEQERESFGDRYCGPEGKFFEEKPGFFKTIKSWW